MESPELVDKENNAVTDRKDFTLETLRYSRNWSFNFNLLVRLPHHCLLKTHLIMLSPFDRDRHIDLLDGGERF